jgi:hypothetical protein
MSSTFIERDAVRILLFSFIAGRNVLNYLFLTIMIILIQLIQKVNSRRLTFGYAIQTILLPPYPMGVKQGISRKMLAK